MAIAMAIFALIIVLLSGYGAFFPSALTSFVRRVMASPAALWVAVVPRLILFVLLWFSAPLSQTPVTFHVLAIIALLAAMGLPIMGAVRILKLIDWVASWRQVSIRLACLLGVGFGGFLFWSISPVWAAA